MIWLNVFWKILQPTGDEPSNKGLHISEMVQQYLEVRYVGPIKDDWCLVEDS